MKENLVEIEVELDEELIAQLQALADARGMTLNDLMVEAVKEELDRKKNENLSNI